MQVAGKVCLVGIQKIMIYFQLIMFILDNQSKIYYIKDFGTAYQKISMMNLKIIAKKYILTDFQNALNF